MEDQAKKLADLKEQINKERGSARPMRQHTKEQHEPMDNAFTVELTANDPFYAEQSADAKYSKHDCKGYIAITFADAGATLLAQGMTNLRMLIDTLMSMYPYSEIRNALAVVMAKKLTCGELSLEEMKDFLFGGEK